MSALTAHDGLTLPPIGFGTYKLNGSAGVEAVRHGIANGYTLLDSAFNYENEGAVGRGVREGDADRATVIVTSKLPGRRHAYDEAMRTVEESLYRTGLDALDLYLIHWPNPRVDLYVQAWRALVDARDAGLVRHIGVSNFLPEHIDRLERETGEVPAVNQLEIHPYFPQSEAVAYAHERGIVVEAWSPVGRGSDVVREARIEQIGEAYGLTPVQTILAWHVARGVVPIPKSADPGRQRENLAATDVMLSADDVEAITALGRVDGRLKDQDPAEYEEF